jgi:hypothetical protein
MRLTDRKGFFERGGAVRLVAKPELWDGTVCLSYSDVDAAMPGIVVARVMVEFYAHLCSYRRESYKYCLWAAKGVSGGDCVAELRQMMGAAGRVMDVYSECGAERANSYCDKEEMWFRIPEAIQEGMFRGSSGCVCAERLCRLTERHEWLSACEACESSCARNRWRREYVDTGGVNGETLMRYVFPDDCEKQYQFR